MKLLIASLLLIFCFPSIGQNFTTKGPLTFYPGTFIDSEHRYINSTGGSFIIQNSLAAWGGHIFQDATTTREFTYTAASGQKFGCIVFWYRIINENDFPVQLTLNFPADSFANEYSPKAYFKLYFPPDTMDLVKEGRQHYGLTGLVAFLDANFDKPSTLQATIGSRESYMFYVALLDHYPVDVEPVPVRRTRAKLVLDEGSLFYDINLHMSALIPCGQITSKH